MDLYLEITNRVIAELEKGIVPWQKPWTGTRQGPYSRSTGLPYSLLNQMLLGKPGEYLTFKQCMEDGGKVRKGEKAHMVVFWKPIPFKDTDSTGDTVERIIPYLRYYNVFHIDQCDGIEPKYTPEFLVSSNPVAAAEDVIEGYKIRENCTVCHQQSNRAYYSASEDVVVMPLREQFPREEGYYSTFFHELVHSTGHKSRLDRLSKDASFGNEEYSKEELIAEIGTIACMNELGLGTTKTFKNSTAYIGSWLRALQNDKHMIVSATGKSEKAVNFIFGREKTSTGESK